MAENMLYGDQVLALFPNNTQGLIQAEHMRSMWVSQKAGGMLVKETTQFTIPITDGVPVSINPLLPAPVTSGVLWVADGNNRGKPNYAAAIPSVIIPAGYSKFAAVSVVIAVEKVGAGDDLYLFQVDKDGVPVGIGVQMSLSVEPTVITLLASELVDITDPNSVFGVTVTGIGTGDDIDVSNFSMDIQDLQIWSAP